MSRLQILIVDDHEVVRRGLRVLIEQHPEWEVCGEAKDGREAVEKARELKPDVVVMDIGMPELNGLEATRQILKAARRTEVLILTARAVGPRSSRGGRAWLCLEIRCGPRFGECD